MDFLRIFLREAGGSMLLAVDQQRQAVLAEMAVKGATYRCPNCREPVILRQGAVKLSHFAHRRHSECSQAFSEGESREHLLGKRQLYDLFRPHVRLEVYLPGLKQRPDLLVGRTAVEYQCSPLDFQRFMDRTAGYLDNDYHPVWILGSRFRPKDRLTEFQKACCFYRRQRLQLWVLDSLQQCFEVAVDFQWHYSGEFFYQREALALGELAKLDQLRLPPHQKVLDWSAADYQQQLWEKLVRMDKGIVALQQACYERGQHLLQLPEWFYQSSPFQFFYGHQLLLLRLFFKEAPDYQHWRRQVDQHLPQWLFPLVPREFVLREVYQECRIISAGAAVLKSPNSQAQIRQPIW